MDNVVFNLNTSQQHFWQILSGFLLLQKQGQVKLSIKYGEWRKSNTVAEATINHIPVAYDINDSSVINEVIYSKVAVYFKRMCLKTEMVTHPKLYPLGFNYLCYTKGWDFFKINHRLLPLFKKVGLQRLRYLPWVPDFLGWDDSIPSCNCKLFETDNINRQFLIQFSTRLWRWGYAKNSYWIEERQKFNEARIELVRLLKENFEGMYFGGIQDGPLARELAPELVLDKKAFNKKNYVNNLKKSTVGIVTPGVEDSIAWKFGEYVASGMAILCTPEFLKYELPGSFKEGQNYLIFNSSEECLEKIRCLQKDKPALQKMMQANIDYYKKFLQPDVLINNTILITNRTKAIA